MPKTSQKDLDRIKAWQEANADKVKGYKDKYSKSERGRAKKREYERQRFAFDEEYREKKRSTWRKYNKSKTPEWRRERKLWEYYRITVDEYNAMLEKQGGVCAICGQEETMRGPTGRTRYLSVDHDHETGEVRALLCTACNTGIGYFNEDVDRMFSAIKYLVGGQ